MCSDGVRRDDQGFANVFCSRDFIHAGLLGLGGLASVRFLTFFCRWDSLAALSSSVSFRICRTLMAAVERAPAPIPSRKVLKIIQASMAGVSHVRFLLA